MLAPLQVRVALRLCGQIQNVKIRVSSKEDGCRDLKSLVGEIMKKYRLTAMLCTIIALTSCTDTEARVNNSLKHAAEELVSAVSDATYREGFSDHAAFEKALRLLPDQKVTTRSFRSFRWEGDALHAVVSFSNSAQKTEAEGTGRYSARACAELVVTAREIRLMPTPCPAKVPLRYGSTEVADYELPEIKKRVESRYG